MAEPLAHFPLVPPGGLGYWVGMRFDRCFAVVSGFLMAVLMGGCGSGDAEGTGGGASQGSTAQGTGGGGGTGGASAEDIDMTDADFVCVLDWTKVRKFRITNLLGHIDETLAVANAPGMSDYPVGTVIQLIPTEAMVKRRQGFSASTNDWEFFFLSVSASGTMITNRGTTDVVNGLGGNCLNCHSKAAPEWDFVCEEGHGCDPLPFTADQIQMVQDSDPRCP